MANAFTTAGGAFNVTDTGDATMLSATTDTIAESTSAAGVTVDGCLIKDGRAANLATAALFLSDEQTGTGSEQSITHGFATAPSLAFAVVTEIGAGAASGVDIAHGTHTASVCKFTVTSGIKYRVVAIR